MITSEIKEKTSSKNFCRMGSLWNKTPLKEAVERRLGFGRGDTYTKIMICNIFIYIFTLLWIVRNNTFQYVVVPFFVIFKYHISDFFVYVWNELLGPNLSNVFYCFIFKPKIVQTSGISLRAKTGFWHCYGFSIQTYYHTFIEST